MVDLGNAVVGNAESGQLAVFFEVERLVNVEPQKLKLRILEKRLDVADVPRGKVVNTNDVGALAQKSLAQKRADESSSAGYKNVVIFFSSFSSHRFQQYSTKNSMLRVPCRRSQCHFQDPRKESPLRAGTL